MSRLRVPAADIGYNIWSRDSVGNKTDAAVVAVGTDKSLMAYIKGLVGYNTGAERVAVSGAKTMVNADVIFTIEGGPIGIVSLVSMCITGNDATASTVQYQAVPTVGTATTISGASGSIANAAAGAVVTLQTTALNTAALYAANGPTIMATGPSTILVPAGTIKVVIGTGSTTGTWRHYLRYKPLAAGVTVT
jgi:hypothetical protein